MKCLGLLCLAVVTTAFEIRVTRSELPQPRLRSMTAVDPPGFEVEWDPVKSGDEKDPVLGYKVKIWELPGSKTYVYKFIDGVKTLVEETSQPEVSFPIRSDKIPDGKPKEVVTDKTKLLYRDVKLDVEYETRVQAYTKTMEGPLSKPMRIKLQSDEHSKDIYRTI